MTIETARVAGPFRVHKADRARPRRAHPTFEAAEAEAHRLATLQPRDAFVIAQEVAHVGQAGDRHE
ncbi:hypothetical protein [Sphingomonas tagetis]|uniref:hypothetical protein n=1 Tax=Sphingomonas tagetis TaxID=2949092 RepID=UPI0020B8C13E|nr:hypothetical protein [Sphingomonas tagetis]